MNPHLTTGNKVLESFLMGNQFGPHVVLVIQRLIRVFDNRTTALRDDAGSMIGRISINRDVTDRYEVDRMKNDYVFAVLTGTLDTPKGRSLLMAYEEKNLPGRLFECMNVHRKGGLKHEGWHEDMEDDAWVCMGQ